MGITSMTYGCFFLLPYGIMGKRSAAKFRMPQMQEILYKNRFFILLQLKKLYRSLHRKKLRPCSDRSFSGETYFIRKDFGARRYARINATEI